MMITKHGPEQTTAALLFLLLPMLAAAAEAGSCGRVGWNAVAVLLTSPCNAAAGERQRPHTYKKLSVSVALRFSSSRLAATKSLLRIG